MVLLVCCKKSKSNAHHYVASVVTFCMHKEKFY